MPRKRVSLAEVATFVFLGAVTLRADDGKPDQAGKPAGSTKGSLSVDQAKAVLRDAVKVIQALADDDGCQELRMTMQSPAEFAMRFTRDQHPDTLRAVGRAWAGLATGPRLAKPGSPPSMPPPRSR